MYRPSQKERQQLNLIEHKGLMYVRGRLDKSSLASTTVTPLYIPRHSPLLPLICYEYHRANLHAGVTTTLANVRVRYWFTHGRRVVASAIRLRCADCRKLKNPPYSVPPWPVLPSARVNPSRPFSKVGVDYFGPVLLKSNAANGIPSAVVEKYYVCLFTCLCVRAVHCELVSDLTTEQFFHAFKRFTARRSFPDEVLSDNGTTFLAARQTIRTIIRSRRGQQRTDEPPHLAHAGRPFVPEPISSRTRARTRTAALALASAGNPAETKGIPFAMLLASQSDSDPAEDLHSFFDANNITWGTITDRAAWRGGTYERMIGLIKDCLTKTLGRSRPTVDHYQTLLTQAEYIVNTRPLTYVHNSEREFTLVRPIDFLIPTLQGDQLESYLEPAIDSQPNGDPDYAPAIASDKVQRRLLRDLELATRLTDTFWKLWRDGYLIEQRRSFGKLTAGHRVHPEVGDIVLVYTDNVPRTHWRLALVLEFQPDEDSVVRTARIRLSGTGRETLRAVNHLYPLKPLIHDDDTRTDALAASAAPAGPSTPSDSMGRDIVQGNRESGIPPSLSSTSTIAEGGGNSRLPPEISTPTEETSPNKNNTTPHTIEDRTPTEPTSRATASSSRGRRGTSRRYGPAARRRR